MVIRLILGLALAGLLYWFLRRALAKRKLTVKQFFAVYGVALAALALVALGLSGRLHPIAAAIGVVLTMGTRLLPWLMRGLQAFNLMKAFRATRNAQGAASGPTAGGQSKVRSHFLSMTLDHDAGEIDGEVLQGSFKGLKLSDLSLSDLLSLRSDMQSDPESVQLLEAFLSRAHPNWEDDLESSNFDAGDDDFNAALNCLELKWPCSEADVVAAHRRLIQRHHPDHGGTHEQAAALNAAKTFLLDAIGSGRVPPS